MKRELYLTSVVLLLTSSAMAYGWQQDKMFGMKMPHRPREGSAKPPHRRVCKGPRLPRLAFTCRELARPPIRSDRTLPVPDLLVEAKRQLRR